MDAPRRTFAAASQRRASLARVLLSLTLTASGAHAADGIQSAPAEDAATAPASSQDAEPMRVVEVTGLRAVPWKSYRAMLVAETTYREYKDELAPQAQFLFAVLPPPGQQFAKNFALRVRMSDGREVPIRFERENMFKLPALPVPDPDAELVSNFKGGRLRIGMHLRTPNVPPESLRLGDLRLACRIEVGLERDEQSLLARLILPDRCTSRLRASKHSSIGQLPTSGAILRQADREMALPAVIEGNKVAMYKVPLHDTAWSNDALVIFDYKDPPKGLMPELIATFRLTELAPSTPPAESPSTAPGVNAGQ
jgi:hypothetical protein